MDIDNDNYNLKLGDKIIYIESEYIEENGKEEYFKHKGIFLGWQVQFGETEHSKEVELMAIIAISDYDVKLVGKAWVKKDEKKIIPQHNQHKHVVGMIQKDRMLQYVYEFEWKEKWSQEMVSFRYCPKCGKRNECK